MTPTWRCASFCSFFCGIVHFGNGKSGCGHLRDRSLATAFHCNVYATLQTGVHKDGRNQRWSVTRVLARRPSTSFILTIKAPKCTHCGPIFSIRFGFESDFRETPATFLISTRSTCFPKWRAALTLKFDQQEPWSQLLWQLTVVVSFENGAFLVERAIVFSLTWTTMNLSY